MSFRDRARRSAAGFPSPRVVRQVAFIATGWVVLSMIAAVYFSLSYVVSVIVSFVAPVYFGIVLPNGWATVADPGRDNGWLQAGVGLVGLMGLAVRGYRSRPARRP